MADITEEEQEILVALTTQDIYTLAPYDLKMLIHNNVSVRDDLRRANERIIKLEKVLDDVFAVKVCKSCGWHLRG